MDFAEIDEHVAPLVRQLDHQVLNEIDGLANPTSELLAFFFFPLQDQKPKKRFEREVPLQCSNVPSCRR